MNTNPGTGAIKALLGEYERAASDLVKVLSSVSDEDFFCIFDTKTEDPDCRSVQTIMNHVIRSGYGYSNYLRKFAGDTFVERKDDYALASAADACRKLHEMLLYTSEGFADKNDTFFTDTDKTPITVAWGPEFNTEQLVEHAIVHILRHRRQIEKFLFTIQKSLSK